MKELKQFYANAESHLRFEIALKQRLKAFYCFKLKAKRFKVTWLADFRGFWNGPVVCRVKCGPHQKSQVPKVHRAVMRLE